MSGGRHPACHCSYPDPNLANRIYAEMRRIHRSKAKGIAAGVLGGLAGSVALKGFIVAARRAHGDTGSPSLDQTGPSHQVAELAFHGITGRSLTPQERVLGGEIVHYAFGAVVGAIYGGLAESQPWVTAGKGLLFGVGVFVAADETSMPALGLTNKPWDETFAAQAEHLAAHLVFGVLSELARAPMRKLLG